MAKIQEMSDSEKEIMKIIWDNGGSIYIAELLTRAGQIGKGWKRTTVRTFIARLMEKGLIVATRQGRVSRYTAAVSEEEYLAGRAQDFVEEYFGGSVKHLLTSLFGRGQLDAGAVDELQRFWDKCKEGS